MKTLLKLVKGKAHVVALLWSVVLGWQVTQAISQSLNNFNSAYSYEQNVRSLEELKGLVIRSYANTALGVALSQASFIEQGSKDLTTGFDKFKDSEYLPDKESDIAAGFLAFQKGIKNLNHDSRNPTPQDKNLQIRHLADVLNELTLSLDEEIKVNFDEFIKASSVALEMQDRLGKNVVLLILLVSFGLMGMAWSGINRLEAENMLSESEKLHKWLFNSLTEGIFIIRDDGTILMSNRRAQKLLAAPAEQLENHNIAEIFPQVLSSDDKLLNFDGSPLVELLQAHGIASAVKVGYIESSNKVRWLRFAGQRIPQSERFSTGVTIVSFADISLEVAREKVINDQRIKIAESQKLSALGEMSAGIAHEINNPLGVIRGHADLLELVVEKKGKIETQQTLKFTGLVRSMIDRVVRIISGMKRLSHTSVQMDMSSISLQKLVEETLAVSANRLKNGEIEVRNKLPEKPLVIMCHETQIAQALLNLIQNSADAIENHQEKWIEISILSADENEVKLAVTDSGSGISAQNQSKIFQPFFTTKEVGKGTGLGMSITRQIVESHGGEISIDNDCPNTRFVIRLPRHPAINEGFGQDAA